MSNKTTLRNTYLMRNKNRAPVSFRGNCKKKSDESLDAKNLQTLRKSRRVNLIAIQS